MEFAKHHHSDLIVIGSRGLGGFEQMLIGSVSNYVAHHAPCPVLVVRSRRKQSRVELQDDYYLALYGQTTPHELSDA